MIYYLEGKPSFFGGKFLVLEINGVGYKIFLSPKNLVKIKENKKVLQKIFTFLHLKEDALELYGFLTKEELELFEALMDVQGIGPKAALSLSSIGSLEALKAAIEKGDTKIFEGIKGIGKKKIQKIILELTGRLRELKKDDAIGATDEALEGLVSLGFPRQRAKEALSKVSPEIKNTEEKVKEALKKLTNR